MYDPPKLKFKRSLTLFNPVPYILHHTCMHAAFLLFSSKNCGKFLRFSPFFISYGSELSCPTPWDTY